MCNYGYPRLGSVLTIHVCGMPLEYMIGGDKTLILLTSANLCKASYLFFKEFNSSLTTSFSRCNRSTSARKPSFSPSKISFCVILFSRQFAAYPRFFNVLRLCFNFIISSLGSPFSSLLSSLTVIATSSSSWIGGEGVVQIETGLHCCASIASDLHCDRNICKEKIVSLSFRMLTYTCIIGTLLYRNCSTSRFITTSVNFYVIGDVL